MNLDTRNSVAFPADDAGASEEPGQGEGAGRDKRTISELLKLHAEKGKDVTFSAEEAGRIAEVLGQWVSRVLLLLRLGLGGSTCRGWLSLVCADLQSNFSCRVHSLLSGPSLPKVTRMCR